MRYKKVVLDIETTGLDRVEDEILQISIIDQDGNTLIDEYCKPEKIVSWEEAQRINNITPAMVIDKKPFKYYSELVGDILNSSEEVIIYNADFELAFLDKYGIEVHSKVYDLMIEFAEVYGDFNEYYGNYTWKSLDTCCLYYGYYLDNAHNSLEDCKATLYCYNSLIANKGRYKATEYIGETVGDFIADVKSIVGDMSIDLFIRTKPSLDYEKSIYVDKFIKSIEDIEYKTLLDCKILDLNFYSFKSYDLYVEKCIEAELGVANKKIEKLKEELKKKEDEAEEYYLKNKILEREITKHKNENLKLKQDLGLIEKPKIYMFNSYGYYTAEYCKSTRKPMFKSRREYEPFSDKLLSKSRCKEIKVPVKDYEEIYAFYRVRHGYCALYFRDTNSLSRENTILINKK